MDEIRYKINDQDDEGLGLVATKLSPFMSELVSLSNSVKDAIELIQIGKHNDLEPLEIRDTHVHTRNINTYNNMATFSGTK